MLRKQITNQQQGSALLIVLMMVILLTIMIMDLSFSSQTAFSLAKNRIEKAQMDAIAESAFAYALNMVQINNQSTASAATTQTTTTNTTTVENKTTENNQLTGNSLFSQIDSFSTTDPTATGPKWQTDFPIVSINNIKMKLKISLEESKININRIVNSEDKVDIRIRTALIEIFKKFEGTEEDVDRMIDYIDTNQLGQFEDNALNARLQSIGELLRIPKMSVKYTLKDPLADETAKKSINPTPNSNEIPDNTQMEKALTLSDFITVYSTGRININYAHEDILSNLMTSAPERPVLENILQSRETEPFKSLNQLALNKNFGSTFKKLANYVTTDENTFKVTVILRSQSSFKSRIYIGYIYKNEKSTHYLIRTERTYSNDVELEYDGNEIPDQDGETAPESNKNQQGNDDRK